MVNLDFTVSAAMVLVPALVLFAVLVLLRDRVSSPGRAALAGAGISLAFERTQMLSYILFSSGRSVDINDVIANTLGTVLGFLALRWAARARSLAGLVQELALPSARPVGIPTTGRGHAGPAS
jgi:hypothetical protein